MSDYLLAPSDFCKMCLKDEQVRGRVDVTGNLIVDVCKKLSRVATKPTGLDLPEDFVLLTMHRPENVDDPSQAKLAEEASFPGRFQSGIPDTSKNSSQYEKV